MGGEYGLIVGGTLVPETVPNGEFAVGRFEVTRAQFAAFDPTWAFPTDEGSHPATGITFEKAQAYARWLAKRTGTAYRLPTETEARSLVKSAGRGGNTLDTWAGYAPNFDDAQRLQEAIRELPGVAPLLLPVGSMSPNGTPAIFDLDGNAAEWAQAEDGSGVLVGPSADRPSQTRDHRLQAGEAYRGFRVVSH